MLSRLSKPFSLFCTTETSGTITNGWSFQCVKSYNKGIWLTDWCAFSLLISHVENTYLQYISHMSAFKWPVYVSAGGVGEKPYKVSFNSTTAWNGEVLLGSLKNKLEGVWGGTQSIAIPFHSMYKNSTVYTYIYMYMYILTFAKKHKMTLENHCPSSKCHSDIYCILMKHGRLQVIYLKCTRIPLSWLWKR